MRFLIGIPLFAFLFCNLYLQPFCDAQEKTEGLSRQAPPFEVHADTLWAESLETFQGLLNTDLKAARAELQNVAKELFGEHTLIDEWVPLFFRISKDGTKEISDVKRLAELEMRMLAAIAMETKAFEKYAPFMQHLQEAYQKYEDWENAADKVKFLKPHGTKTDKVHGGDEAENVEDSSDIQVTDFKAFYEKNPEAARKQLIAIISREYNEDPRVEKLVDAFLKIGTQEHVSYPDMIEFTELHLQLMKATNAEKYKESIQVSEKSLKQFKHIANLLEKQGSLETDKVKVSLDFSILLPRKKEEKTEEPVE